MSFNVKFKINDNLEVTECGLDNMMFAEFIYNLSQKVGLKEEHKPTFTFNSEILKMDSMRKLSEIGITSNSVINVKTEKPLDYKPQNTGNSEAPQNNSASTGTNMNAGNMNMNQNMYAGAMNMNQNMYEPKYVCWKYEYESKYECWSYEYEPKYVCWSYEYEPKYVCWSYEYEPKYLCWSYEYESKYVLWKYDYESKYVLWKYEYEPKYE